VHVDEVNVSVRETNFDGLVGPTHNYGGLSAGNVASMSHGGATSSPKQAALQGLGKMRFNRSLGLSQGVLVPHERPHLPFLQSIGFTGSDEEVLAKAATVDGGHPLRLASSAAAMWTANAATIAPSVDAADGRLHLLPANLHQMMHRALEADTTTRVLTSMFGDDEKFCVHDALPGGGHYADEGAANHTRLATDDGVAHLFAWGRSAFRAADVKQPQVHPARQTLEASQAAARLLDVDEHAVFWQQDPQGIDDGAFHTDVMAVGNGHLLLYHERAFVDADGLMSTLRKKLGDTFVAVEATQAELPASDAVASYPFNSQLVTLPDGSMAIIAPTDAEENAAAHAFLQKVKDLDVGVSAVHYLDVKQSMRNGGGPACLRLRVAMTPAEEQALTARVLVDDALNDELVAWVEQHYRDALHPSDLQDPQLWRESLAALDELTQILQLGSVYDFQC